MKSINYKSKDKNIRVPNMDIKIRPHELLVINTPTFQRLFTIKQLGLAYLVYPYATHTRGAHSLDCVDMAQRIINSINDPLINKDEENLIRLSALLHDIMHIPYSHTLENENVILEKHDKSDRIDKMIDLLKKEITLPEKEKWGDRSASSEENYKKIVKLLGEVSKVLWTIALHDKPNPENRLTLENERYYISDIIGNTISADLLSYIKRDVEHTGIEKKPGGYRIFDYFELRKDDHEPPRTRLAIRLTKGGLRHDVISAILSILDVRYALTEHVIYHHAKCAASAMLGRVAQLCDLKESEDLYGLGDEGFIGVLNDKIKHLPQETNDGRPYKKGVKDLLDNLMSRRLYKRIFKVTFASRLAYDQANEPSFAVKFRQSEERKNIEESIEKLYGFPAGSIAIFCPQEDMALKEAKAMVTFDKVAKDSSKPKSDFAYELRGEKFRSEYPDVWERVNTLERQYSSIWSFYVFLDPKQFGYVRSIRRILESKDLLNIKSDPLLEPYLEEKEEYRETKIIDTIGTPRSAEAEAEVYKGVITLSARDSKTLDRTIVKQATESAFGSPKRKVQKVSKEKLTKTEKMEESQLFPKIEHKTEDK